MKAVHIELVGDLWGLHVSDTGEVIGKIIHVVPASIVNGPAENAFIYAELHPDGRARGRYISWINYYDIEHAARQQPGKWHVVEPPQTNVSLIEWCPYGWGGPTLPSVAYESRNPA